MPNLAILLPCRRPELVAWPARDTLYLVRNRRTGEVFQLGEAEHFLLARLDGRLDAEQLRAAFARRFGQQLSDDDLAGFLELARASDFLQPEAAATRPLLAHGFGACPSPPTPAPRPELPRRVASRLLHALAAASQWLAGLAHNAAAKLQSFRLTHFEFVPRPDDLFIVTYPRSGTTWMQMILYQLTTEGGMDFPHIAEYCPWFERSLRSARGFDTRPSPRLFKSHLPYARIPKGPCKYLYVARDGKDVAVSCYHLCRRYNGYDGTFAEFFERFLRGQVEFGSWFQHVRGWWAHRHDPNVLFLTYEELTRDLEGCLRRISAFYGLAVAPERLPLILERCRFSFMKEHEGQFDPALETLWEQGVQLNAFLRHGRTGEGKDCLSLEQAARFARAFEQQLGTLGMDCRRS
jgi:hypothetical protein